MTTINQQLASLPQILTTDANGNTISLSVQQFATEAASLGSISNVFITGGSNGQMITTDGTGNLEFTDMPSLESTPGGSNSSIQFNNNGTLDGASNFLYNPATDTVTVNNMTVNGTMNVNGTAEYNLGDIKIYGGSQNQILQTDGAGNLRWSGDLYPGTVTHVGANGGGLGFSLAANITDDGNVTLTTPDVAGLRSTLNLGSIANIFLTGETNKWLRGDGTFTLPPGQNNPNLVVDGTVYSYANGNLEFKDSQYAYNQIDFRYANGAITAELDYYSPIEFGNTFKVQQITIEDASQATGVTFFASNTAVVNQRYNLPDNYPVENGQALVATVNTAGESFLSWATIQGGGGNVSPDTISTPFAYGDATPKVIGLVPVGCTVTEVTIVMATGMNGVGATLSVGDSANTQLLMKRTDNIASTAGIYSVYPGVYFSAQTQLLLDIGSAFSSAGHGLVFVKYE
jgi:hypothetical protein